MRNGKVAGVGGSTSEMLKRKKELLITLNRVGTAQSSRLAQYRYWEEFAVPETIPLPERDDPYDIRNWRLCIPVVVQRASLAQQGRERGQEKTFALEVRRRHS
uniref:Transposase n=1 Tax=Ascaris lumbricoides TaxID=6252 RepID=A0A0M3HWW7_ASCLU